MRPITLGTETDAKGKGCVLLVFTGRMFGLNVLMVREALLVDDRLVATIAPNHLAIG